MIRSIAIAIAVALATPAAADDSDFGMITPLHPMEQTCLSTDLFQRGMCAGYVAGLEDAYTERATAAQIGRYLEELLTFRNTALHGYTEIVYLMHWLETAEGQQQTVGQEAFVKSAKDHFDRLERARTTFKGLRRR